MALIIDPSTPLTLAQIVGDVLSSLVDAQAQSARTTVDFINAVGFEPAPAGTPPGLRHVRFAYTKLDENQETAEFVVDIPLLGMVDIPLVCIRKATIDLDYDVTEVQDAEGKTAEGKAAKVPRLKGRVLSGRTGSRSERASVKVSVEVEKAELPPGLARALDILELAAREEKRTP